MIAVDSTSFDYVRTLILSETGIVLEPGKEYLVESRLSPLARKAGLPSLDALVSSVRSGRAPELRRQVLDAMTTNETTFFRDGEPFTFLESTVLPQLITARSASRQIRIWYAASSTGQEPYSVSMLVQEKFPQLLNWRFEQVATDISRAALARAKEGKYSQLEVNRGLPAKYLVKHFTKHGLEWQLHDDIRKMVQYDELNLNAPWPSRGKFDIVFIRNVMIYFDVEAKKRILKQIHSLLQPDGYLFLGAAETTFNLEERFVRSDLSRAGCYRPVAR